MRNFCGVIILLLSFSSCQTSRVVSFYNEEVDFGKYKTFAIINPANRSEKLSLENKQSDELIEKAITKELNFKGYKREEPADLWVYYRFILDTNVNYHINDYYPSRQYYDSNQYVNTTEYKEGLLLIEMRDPDTRKTIWQGSLDLKYKSRNKSKVDPLNDAMKMIFESYPFLAGQSKPIKQEEK